MAGAVGACEGVIVCERLNGMEGRWPAEALRGATIALVPGKVIAVARMCVWVVAARAVSGRQMSTIDPGRFAGSRVPPGVVARASIRITT